MDATGQKASMVGVRLAWKPTLTPSEPLVFDFDPKADRRAVEMLRSQLWISSLTAALVWQQPWLAGHWVISSVPLIDGPPVGAALGVGLLAIAANVPFPSDTTILGSLYPDGAIGPVPHILVRIEAAAAAGIKRIIVPNLQRFEVSAAGSFLNVQDYAKSKGMECTFVDHMVQATETVLKRSLPDPPVMHSTTHYEGPLFAYLDSRSHKELATLQELARAWPRKPEQLAQRPAMERELWQQVFKNYDSALDAFQAGLLYVTHERLRKTNALLKAISAPPANGTSYDFKAHNIRATELRQRIAAHIDKPATDQNELQSALVLVEESDWLYSISARLEGAQILARQAFGPRSHATVTQKELSATLLTTAIYEADYLIQELDFYPELYRSINEKHPQIVNNRASWFPQLTPSFLAAAEFLNQGLRQHATEYRETLLFDPKLATHGRMLRDAHTIWEQQLERAAQKQASIQTATEPQKTVDVAFVPGSAYAPPTSPVPPPVVQNLSDTRRTLNWVNEFCEVAILEQKYLGPGGVFEPTSLEWKNSNRAALQGLLQRADLDARQGIAFVEKIGIDPAILILIYERATFLRNTGEDLDKLDALRHFWRCSLLGNFCWQLINNTRIPVPPTPAPAPTDVITATANPAAPAPAPVTVAPPPISILSPAIYEPLEARPTAVSALPVSLDELDQLPAP